MPLFFGWGCILFGGRLRTGSARVGLSALKTGMAPYDSDGDSTGKPFAESAGGSSGRAPGEFSGAPWHVSSNRPAGSGFARGIFSTDHRAIGLNYLWLALFGVFLGLFLSLLMRIHLVWPAAHIPFFSHFTSTPERYAALTTLHGS